jgi:hypothetical protein
MVEELAILGGPANLHDPWGDHSDLIVPHAWVHTEGTADTLEGGRVTACLGREEKGRSIISIEHKYYTRQCTVMAKSWEWHKY